MIPSSLQQLSPGGGQDKRLSRERARMQLGKRKQHVRASNHQLTLFICCVVSARLFHHRSTVGLSEYIKTARERNRVRERQRERKKQRFLRETPASAFCLAFSFFHFSLCNIISPLCPAFIAPPHPSFALSLSLCLSLSVSSQKQSWVLGAKGRRQTR